MHILFLSGWFPYPIDNGSKLRVYNLLRGLAQVHDITLLSFYDSPGIDTNPQELRSLCKQVLAVPLKAFQPDRLKNLFNFFSPTPRLYSDIYSVEMAGRIQEVVSSQEISLVIASQFTAASYAGCFRDVPALFEEVEVGVLYEKYIHAQGIWRRFRHGLTWTKQHRYMKRLIPHFRACTVASERERRLLSRMVPNFEAIEVIPNCINLADYRDISTDPQPDTLIFSGSFRYSANHDAMIWFIQEVMPLIQKEAPNVRLLITGDHCDLPLPRAKNVVLTGYVEDIRPLIASASISLAPLRIGSGTRLKILEAMALGTPVVSTSKGAEGLDAQPDVHLLIEDTPEKFAEKVLCLLRDPNLSDYIKKNAYQLVREKYDLAAVLPHFLSIVQRAAQA
jgi:glycosyltransferase involved in cell wall biosynthesis